MGIALRIGVDDENEIVLRIAEAKLCSHAEGTEATARHSPDLIAVAEGIVCDEVEIVVANARVRHIVHERFIQIAFAVKRALVEKEAREEQKISRRTKDTRIRPGIAAHRLETVRVLGKTDLRQEFLLQILQKGLARQLLYNDAKHERARAVIVKKRCGKLRRMIFKISSHAVGHARQEPMHTADRALHRQKLTDGGGVLRRALSFGIFGKEFGDRIVEREQAVLLTKADGDRYEALRSGVHTVLEVLVEGLVIAFRKNGIPARQDHAVNGNVVCLQQFIKFPNVGGGYARLLGCTNTHSFSPVDVLF